MKRHSAKAPATPASTPKAPKAPKATDSVAARERILDAAEELFASDGFDATPTSRIAQQAEVPKGLIHYYFHRKLDLLVALVDRHTDSDLQGELDVDLLVVPGDPAASLRRLVRASDALVRRSRMLHDVLWREADTHDAVRAALDRRLRRLVEQIRSLLAKSTPIGLDQSKLDSAAELAGLTLSYRHSVMRHGKPPGDCDRLMDFIAAGILTALTAPA